MTHPIDPQSACYFLRIDANRYRATDHVGGAWNQSEQHIAPALGLLAHAIEADHKVRRDDGLAIGRLSYDILGTLPIDIVDIDVSVLRPGRTIELVEARMKHEGRTAVVARAWLMQAYDSAPLAGTAFPPIAPPDTMKPWAPSTIWPGGFARSVETRKTQGAAGRAVSWIRTDASLIGGETVSPTAHALAIVDIANGLTPRAGPDVAAFPNLDLTVHLFESPRGDWLGLDTTVSFGPSGVGLTHSIVHDAHGPIGVVSQCLTVRPL